MLALNKEKQKYQACIVPAGQGKSRIETAIAIHFLLQKGHDVYMLYCNEGLMKRDQHEYEFMWTLLRGSGLA